jgi:hypothetical protein
MALFVWARKALNRPKRRFPARAVVLLLGCAAYLGLGVLYAQKVLGRTVAGGGGTAAGKLKLGALSIHPHAGWWAELFALVCDGMAFSRGGGNAAAGRRGVGARVVEAGGGSLKKEKEKKEKGGKEHSSSPKSKEKKAKKEKVEALAEPLQPAAAAAAAPASVAAEGTAAGGGGRWVHVPV